MMSLETGTVYKVPRCELPTNTSPILFAKALVQDHSVVFIGEDECSYFFKVRNLDQSEQFKDTSLSRALLDQFSISPQELVSWRTFCSSELTSNCLISFQHNWSLTCWARAKRSTICPSRDPQILHIDSHFDCESPGLICEPTTPELYSLFTRENFNSSDMENVNRLIACGHIGIGSFIVPYLHSAPETDFFCLVPNLPNYQAIVENGNWHLKYVPYWGCDFRYGMVQLRHEHKKHQGKKSRFVVATNFEEIASLLDRQRPLIIDIDLDYFFNSYDWPPGIQMTAGDIFSKITKLSACVFDLARAFSVVGLTIATSPGFFPSILWKHSLFLLCEQLHIETPAILT